jgi:hypothetical protein
MDERLEKAFQTANFMATLTNQRRAALEEFRQNSIYYVKGSSFVITRELIAFVKSMIDLNYTQNIVLIDDNDVPVSIDDLTVFQKEILAQYYSATSEYHSTYTAIKSKRKAEDLINL